MGRSDPAVAAAIDADAQAQFAALGIRVPIDKEADDAMQIWAIHADSLEAFLACGTQWVRAIGPGYCLWLALDYARVDVVLRRRNYGDAVFADIQVMERAAIAAFAEGTP